jgi:multiple sugar transport system permease protein
MERERQNPLFYMVLIVLVIMAVGPIMLMLATSLKLNVDIMSDRSSLLFMPTLRNYETALCAYAIVRFRFIGRDTASLSTLLMRMVPPAVLLVPVFGIWTFQYGISGTRYGIILVYVAMNLPFVIWILQSFIVQVPVQLEEAARMDGAGPFQVFFLVVLPLIKPGLAAAAIFTFRIGWNEFLLANALSDRSTRTVPVTIVNSLTEYNIDWGVIMATGMLLAIPPILFTFFASRQIITGMTAGAVKG